MLPLFNVFSFVGVSTFMALIGGHCIYPLVYTCQWAKTDFCEYKKQRRRIGIKHGHEGMYLSVFLCDEEFVRHLK